MSVNTNTANIKGKIIAIEVPIFTLYPVLGLHPPDPGRVPTVQIRRGATENREITA
jgi:hypothetical protein